MGYERLITSRAQNRKAKSGDIAKRCFKYNVDKLFNDKYAEEMAKKHNQKMGNGKYIDAGIIARLFDIYDLSLDINEINSKLNVASFIYGYYDVANLQLKLMGNGIISERVNDLIKKYKIELHYDLTPDNNLYEVGKRDALDEHIVLTKLPNEVQNNKFYLEGYKESLVKLQERGKGR